MAKDKSQPQQTRHRHANRVSALEQVNFNAAGIDVGAEFHFAAVPEDRDVQPIRPFGAVTGEMSVLADWLEQCD